MAKPKDKKAKLGEEDSAYKAPTIMRHPMTQTVQMGTKLRLMVQANGVPVPKFRWKHNGQKIDGVMGNVLVIPKVQRGANGEYIVEAYNVAGEVESRLATITIMDKKKVELPDVYVDPPSTVATPGEQFVFTARLKENLKTNRFQWLINGKKVKGATKQYICIKNAKEKYVGSYTVEVKNEAGVIVSEPAKMVLGIQQAEASESAVVDQAAMPPLPDLGELPDLSQMDEEERKTTFLVVKRESDGEAIQVNAEVLHQAVQHEEEEAAAAYVESTKFLRVDPSMLMNAPDEEEDDSFFTPEKAAASPPPVEVPVEAAEEAAAPPPPMTPPEDNVEEDRTTFFTPEKLPPVIPEADALPEADPLPEDNVEED